MMTIKTLSEQLNISAHTIRYYEKIGLIQPKRGDNKYRHYHEADVFNLILIQVLQYAQFELKEIKIIIDSFYLPPSDDCHTKIDQLFKNKTKSLEDRIKNYQHINQLIKTIPFAEDAKTYEKNQKVLLEQTQKMVFEVFETIRKGKNDA